MKKLFLSGMMCLMTLMTQAQRCAVLEFKAGVGISQADVDGISAIFITYFRPEGYTMVERTQIDKVIDEEGFQRSSMTESQMVRIGEILNVSKIVVGDVNVVMGQYNVDARVINVESGTLAATEGATFASGSTYRTTMQNLAQELAHKIAIEPNISKEEPEPSGVEPTVPWPITIYDYLKVFPTDLGTFDGEPKAVINRINQSKQYDYSTWRLPTEEEISLMRAENVIGSGTYMTRERRNSTGIVRLVTDKEVWESESQYVDLGLPSGTMWKSENEGIGYYSYDDANSNFGNALPSINQWKELMNVCEWRWVGKGFDVVGPNGNYIFLPAPGRRYCDGEINYVGVSGYYWSSTYSGGSYYAMEITFVEASSYYSTTEKHDKRSSTANSCKGFAVRLVTTK